MRQRKESGEWSRMNEGAEHEVQRVVLRQTLETCFRSLFVEFSTFYTFLYRQIHHIKKCPKGALRTP